MFFFLTFLSAYWHPAKESSCRLRTFTVYTKRRASNKLKGKRRNCCLSPFLPIGCPATRLCLVTTTAYIYVIISPAWLLRPLTKSEENKWHSSILCVRVAIMDNKSFAAIVWCSPPSLNRISQPTNICTHIHTSIIAYRAVRFRWHRILVMHVLVLL